MYRPLCLTIICSVLVTSAVHYEPNWESLDSRPLPAWYDQSKIGIFLHWGLFSVPSFTTEWFWDQWIGQKNQAVINFMEENYRPDFTYQDFGRDFTTEFYNPTEWAQLIAASGAKYVVFVAKHHEGFTNWPSNVSWNWNSMDVGPKRDLVGELRDAINKTDIHFGLYHSLFEWFNPRFLQDQANNFTTQDFVKTKTMPELYELVNKYHPEIIWSDGDWMTNDTYWNATEFIAWLYNESPVKDTVVTNDRWGANTNCKHGGFFNCGDKFNPGHLQPHKWENALSVDRDSWGYRRNALLGQLLTIDEILDIMAQTVSCGGNMLLNVGPTKDGVINPIFQERLEQMGFWLEINGNAIYDTVPWKFQNDTISQNVWYTSKGDNVFAIVSAWPETELLLGAPEPTSETTVKMLGLTRNFGWSAIPEGGIHIKIPKITINELPCMWSWVFKMNHLQN